MDGWVFGVVYSAVSLVCVAVFWERRAVCSILVQLVRIALQLVLAR